MKVLTVHQPWAWAISKGFKDVENRSWSTNYRGRLAIHAGLSKKSLKDLKIVQQLTQINKPDLKFGAIICTVDLIDVVQNSPSIWAIKGQYHWVLANPIEVNSEEIIKGKLGLWDCYNSTIAMYLI